MKDMSNLASLVTRIRAGDANAFDALYRETYNTVYFHAKSILKHEEDALDIVQETYLTAYSTLDTLEQPEAVQAWLCKMASYKAFNLLRSRKHESGLSPDDDDALFEPQADANDEPEYVFDRTATQEIVAGMIRSLPEEQRTALMLYYYDELSLAEIAQVMSCSVNTVKSRLFYARKAVGAQVRAEEKQGVKLYSAAPVLLAAMRQLAQENTLSPAAAAKLGTSLAGTLGYGAASGAAAAAGTAAAGTSLGVKLAAGILAVAVAAGAVAGGIALHKKHAAQDDAPAAQVEVQREEKPAAADLSPEQAQAYYDVLADLSDRVGITEEHYDAAGLAYAELIDFDGDGSQELYLYYIDSRDADGNNIGNDRCLIDEVWAWEGDSCQRVYQDSFMGFGPDSFRGKNIRSKSIIEVDGRPYIAMDYGEWFNGVTNETIELWTLENGSFDLSRTISVSSDDPEDSQAEFRQLADEITNSKRGFTGPGLNRYSTDDMSADDIASISKEWDTNDVRALMQKLYGKRGSGTPQEGSVQTDYTPYAVYVQTILDKRSTQESKFALCDLDKDGVQELLAVCLLNEDPYNEFYIYTLDDDGSMKLLYDSGRRFSATFTIGFVRFDGQNDLAVSYVESDSGQAHMTNLFLLKRTAAGYESVHHLYSYVTTENADEDFETCTLDDKPYSLSDFTSLQDSMNVIEMYPKAEFLQQF